MQSITETHFASIKALYNNSPQAPFYITLLSMEANFVPSILIVTSLKTKNIMYLSGLSVNLKQKKNYNKIWNNTYAYICM